MTKKRKLVPGKLKRFEKIAQQVVAEPRFARPSQALVPAKHEDPSTLDVEVVSPVVLQHLERAAFFDPGEFMSWDDVRGLQLKPSSELTPDQRRLIKNVSEDSNGSVKLEFVNKDRALELLGRATGAIVDRTQLSGKLDVGLMDVLRAIDGRTRGLPAPKTGDE